MQELPDGSVALDQPSEFKAAQDALRTLSIADLADRELTMLWVDKFGYDKPELAIPLHLTETEAEVLMRGLQQVLDNRKALGINPLIGTKSSKRYAKAAGGLLTQFTQRSTG